jgi:plastocyanin domain-containing protein
MNKTKVRAAAAQKRNANAEAARIQQEWAAAQRKKKILVIGGAALVVVVLIVVAIILYSPKGGAGAVASVSGGTQRVTTTSNAGGSGNITVKAGTPVEWTINAGTSLGCRTGLKQSTLGINTALTKGAANVVRFTPAKAGTYRVVCTSMGMAFCTITVT